MTKMNDLLTVNAGGPGSGPQPGNGTHHEEVPKSRMRIDPNHVPSTDPNAKEIHFRNNSQAALWNQEISGQLSDGYWENKADRGSAGEDKTNLYNAKGVVSDKLGRNNVHQGGYFQPNLNNRTLNGIIGDRMLEIGKKAATNPDAYDEKRLKSDLKEMTQIIRMRR